jgi:hypothetical protein
MSAVSTCETHAWVSVGVMTRDGTVYRVWECERCPVWTLAPFDPNYERDWDDTWLAER